MEGAEEEGAEEESAEEESAEGKAQRVTPLALKMTLRVNHRSKTNKPKGETNEKYITSSNHGYRLRFDRHGTARECGDGRQHYLQLESVGRCCNLPRHQCIRSCNYQRLGSSSELARGDVPPAAQD